MSWKVPSTDIPLIEPLHTYQVSYLFLAVRAKFWEFSPLPVAKKIPGKVVIVHVYEGHVCRLCVMYFF